MAFFLLRGEYCEGDIPIGETVTVVPKRPDWTYDWNGSAWVVNAQRAALANAQAKDSAAIAILKADPAVQTFLGWTDAQVQAWITANIADANTQTAVLVLARLVRALSAQARAS